MKMVKLSPYFFCDFVVAFGHLFYIEEWMMVIGGERDYSSVFYDSVTLSSLNGGTIPDCLKNLADFPTTIARGAAAVIGMMGYFL